MRRFPICPCQSGLIEFSWTVVGKLGPQLGGVEIFRCEDCGQTAYRLQTFGFLFLPINERKAAHLDTLKWCLSVHGQLYRTRQEAGNAEVYIRCSIPKDLRVFVGGGKYWQECVTELRLVVPRTVSEPRPMLNPHFYVFFTEPPAICSSPYDHDAAA